MSKIIFGNNVHHRTAVVLRLLDQTEVSSRADRLSACRAILYIAQVGKARDANLFAKYRVIQPNCMFIGMLYFLCKWTDPEKLECKRCDSIKA